MSATALVLTAPTFAVGDQVSFFSRGPSPRLRARPATKADAGVLYTGAVVKVNRATISVLIDGSAASARPWRVSASLLSIRA